MFSKSLKKSSWAIITLLVKSLSTLFINKVFAVFYGTTGIVYLSHFQNLLNIFTQLPNDGINRGVTKYWSSATLDLHRKKIFLSNAILINLCICVSILILLLLFKDYLLSKFFITTPPSIFIAALLCSVFLFLMNLTIQSVLLALERKHAYVFINVFNFIIMISFVMLGIHVLPIDKVLLVYTASQGLSGIVFIYYLNKTFGFTISSFQVDRKVLGKLSEFLMMALSVLLFSKVTDFIVRTEAINQFGITETGLWQGVARLSDIYIMFFVSIISMIFYPKISSVVDDEIKLRQALIYTYRVIVPVLTFGLFFLWFFRVFFLRLLFSTELGDGGAYMPYQLYGDFFNIISMPLAFLLVAHKRTWAFISSQFIYSVVFILFIFYWKEVYMLVSIPMARGVSYTMFFLLLLWLSRKHIFNGNPTH